MGVDLSSKILIQLLMQDNDDSPVVRNALEGDFAFLNTDGGFDNDAAWTKESGWTVASSKCRYNYYTNNKLIYQSCSISSGDNVRFCIQTQNSGSNIYSAYIGGAVQALDASVGYYSYKKAAGATDTKLGIKTTGSGTFNHYFDCLYAYNLDDFPLAGILNASTAKTSSFSVTPGKVQARCLDFSSSYIVVSEFSTVPGVYGIAFWLNPDALTEQDVMQIAEGVIIYIDSTGKIKITDMVYQEHYDVYINNAETNQLSSGWNLVIINIGSMIFSSLNIGASGDYNGKMELLEIFDAILTADERSFLWNGGDGTTELIQAGTAKPLINGNLAKNLLVNKGLIA